MRASAENYKHSDYLNNHKIVIVFDGSTGNAGEIIDLIFCAGAKICTMGYANDVQLGQIINVMQNGKTLPS